MQEDLGLKSNQQILKVYLSFKIVKINSYQYKIYITYTKTFNKDNRHNSFNMIYGFNLNINKMVYYADYNIFVGMADNVPFRFLGAGERPNNQSELKQKLLDKYFITQHQFDEQFVGLIFSLGEHDPQIDVIIQQQAAIVLNSKQKAAIYFLEHLIARARYHHIAHGFLLNLIELKATIYNQPLLYYILRKLPHLLGFLNKNNSEFIHALITFLALKMRSFDFNTRIIALQTLKEFGEVVERQRGQWEITMRKVVPLMIEKQQLVKEVSYIKGLFLQMLEDQFHEVRILSIQCLGIFKDYMRIEDLKQIIVYMLNDQHQLVREQALQTAKFLKNLPIIKQDLETLLMCLKEKRTNLRRLVYQTLSLILINDITLILILLQKILITLQNYRSDKKHIYRTLYQIGNRYYLDIGKIFTNLTLNQGQQPNFKNIGYKAKMILCHTWWKKKIFANDGIILPSYFTKHMLYISDVQSYLFETKTQSIQEQSESTVDHKKISKNSHHLIRFIECQQDISQQFHKTLLEVARQYFMGHTETQILSKKLKILAITFNLGTPQINLKSQLQFLIHLTPKSTQKIIQIVRQIINNRQNFELSNTTVAYNKCTISRLQPNLVVSSKCKQFIQNAYLKCWKHALISKQRKIQYKKVNQLEFLSQNEESYFWRANLSRYSQIQCVLIIPEGEDKILDNYEIDQK